VQEIPKRNNALTKRFLRKRRNHLDR